MIIYWFLIQPTGTIPKSPHQVLNLYWLEGRAPRVADRAWLTHVFHVCACWEIQVSTMKMFLHYYQRSHLALRLAHLTGNLVRMHCMRHSNVFNCLLSSFALWLSMWSLWASYVMNRHRAQCNCFFKRFWACGHVQIKERLDINNKTKEKRESSNEYTYKVCICAIRSEKVSHDFCV